MKKYNKKEIIEILKEYFNAEIFQIKEDYDDEYRFIIDGDEKHIEVVDTLTAIKNVEDFEDNKNEFLWEIIKDLIKFKEIPKIAFYTKIAKDLYYREF